MILHTLLYTATANAAGQTGEEENCEEGNIESFQNKHTFKNTGAALIYIISIVLLVIALIVAVRCNKKNPILYVLIAFFFPEIYLLQFLIRKYALKQANYCVGVGSKVIKEISQEVSKDL